MPRADKLVEDKSSMQVNGVNGQDHRSPVEAPGGVQVQKDTANEPDLGLTIDLDALLYGRQCLQRLLIEQQRLPARFDLAVDHGRSLGVPLTELFQGPVRPENRVVRRAERRQLIHPGRQWRDYLLTPSLTGKLQVILSVIEPGGGSGEEPYAHDSDEECVVILRGRLDFWVGPDRYLLEEGDSIVFESRIPHRNRNPGPEQTEVLWITTPPSY